jgi:hypothetical protein
LEATFVVPKSGMKNRNQMNGLYPIVRRVRRPLLPPEVRQGPQSDADPSVVAGKDEKNQAPEDKDGKHATKQGE